MQFVGNGLQVGLVGFFLQHLLKQEGALTGQPDVSLLDPLPIRKVPGVHQTGGEPINLARQLARHQIHRGRFIQNHGPTDHPSIRGAPMQSMQANWWHWKTAISAEWQMEEHINVLELRACLAAVRWRTRTAAAIGSKTLYLLDSHVALGALQKGRSPKPQLMQIVQKISALCLASSHVTLLGYIRTDINPADKASRSKL